LKKNTRWEGGNIGAEEETMADRRRRLR